MLLSTFIPKKKEVLYLSYVGGNLNTTTAKTTETNTTNATDTNTMTRNITKNIASNFTDNSKDRIRILITTGKCLDQGLQTFLCSFFVK